jgi:hypothetical protein
MSARLDCTRRRAPPLTAPPASQSPRTPSCRAVGDGASLQRSSTPLPRCRRRRAESMRGDGVSALNARAHAGGREHSAGVRTLAKQRRARVRAQALLRRCTEG